MCSSFGDPADTPAPQPSTPSVAASARPSSKQELDQAVAEVKYRTASFADMPFAARALLLRQTVGTLKAAAEDWVKAACEAKRIPFDRPVAAEEWLAGPVVAIRNARLLAESLEAMARSGGFLISGRQVRERRDGRIAVEVFPTGKLDAALFRGFTCQALLQPGATFEGTIASGAGPEMGRAKAALVLGAGNVSSIPAMDVLHRLFAGNETCALKMNPVNEWLGPHLERGLRPLVDAGLLRIVYGGADEGFYLCHHEGIDSVHITGSDRTHDAIVWGPPGPDRERRKRDNDPLLRKPITSELGNVSPVIVVPGPYTADELWFVARNIASMVGNNGSFNCNAAKVLVTAKGWKHREALQAMVASEMSRIAPRNAYYPGAADRWNGIRTAHPEGVELKGLGVEDGALPWLFVKNVDPAGADEPLFRSEPFCAVLAETALDADDPAHFLIEAVGFCNDRLWGTLSATIIIHPRTEKDPATAAALDQAILDLRYGAVAVNHWPGLVYGLVSPPWGGHPSSTLADIKSGIGWVHNTFLLRNVEKSVLRGPLVVKPTPAWFCGNPVADKVAVKLVDFEARPSWLKVPGIALTALRG